MTTLNDYQARFHALLHEIVRGALDVDAADDLLAETIAANAAISGRLNTAALLRRIAEQLDGTNG